MIRPVTCICFAMAVGSGLYLYQAKDAAQVLDRKIEKTVRETEATRDQTRALRTEWTLLNEPDRLRKLAERYLPVLQPVAPPQFANLSDLNARLPPPQVNPPSDQAPLPEEGVVDGASGSDPVIAQPGSSDDLPLPPVPPQSVAQVAATPPVSVQPLPLQLPSAQPVPLSAASGTQSQTVPRSTEHGPAVAKPPVSVALVQPQGPRVPVPEPRPVTPRPDVRASDARPAETRPAPPPMDLRASEPTRAVEPARPVDAAKAADARVASVPRPVAPVRPVASATPSVTAGPPRPTPTGGSLLGMARAGVGGAPPPVPIPRPVPATGMAGQWPNGGG